MQVRSTRNIILGSLALLLGTAALVLHLLAIWSPRWKIVKRDRDPVMGPVSYGLWQRCEYANRTVWKQGVELGTGLNVQTCRPNRYMRYKAQNFDQCYPIRRNCPVTPPEKLPEGCSCRYLPSAKGLQWLTVLAAICLVIGLLILFVKTQVSPQNDSLLFVLNYGPFISFVLTLLLLVTALILFGAYLRRDTYEDYTFPLSSVSNDTSHAQGFELFSLRNYAKHHASTFSKDSYAAAVKELRTDANTHYHTVIGWGTGFEIIATTLIFIVTALAFLLGTASRPVDI